jgi:hypothetical protein
LKNFESVIKLQKQQQYQQQQLSSFVSAPKNPFKVNHTNASANSSGV